MANPIRPGMTKRLDPRTEAAARHSGMPDGGLYGRPATPRTSSANLDLSIATYVIVGIVILISFYLLLR